MNRITTIVAAAFVAISGAASAGTGLAGDISIETTPFVSKKASAEVRAELDAFKQSREPNPSGRLYNPLKHFMSNKNVADVRSDYIVNRGAVAALNGEDSGSRYLAESAAATRRADNMAGNADRDTQH